PWSRSSWLSAWSSGSCIGCASTDSPSLPSTAFCSERRCSSGAQNGSATDRVGRGPMRTFVRHYIVPLARRLSWRSFCEIGARDGTSANYFLRLPFTSYTVIDPCLDEDLQAKYAAEPRIRVLRSNSLDALAGGGSIGPGATFDCILIDGDHNWYPVFNELRLIHERALLRPGGYIFLHDVDWPYG